VWFKHRAWIPVAWVLSLANLGAVWFAARPGQAWHATIHALLAGGFALGAQRLMARHRADAPSEELQRALDQNEQMQQAMQGMESRMQELEERVDFGEQLLAKQREAARLGTLPP
jgi:hypothetical protein